MRVRWILAVVAVSAVAIGVALWAANRDDSPSTATHMPIGTSNPKGDPQAQCKVLALGALQALAQEDASVLASLESTHDPAPHFIAQVVRSNQAAFLEAAKRSTPTQARQQLTAKISADCANAP